MVLGRFFDPLHDPMGHFHLNGKAVALGAKIVELHDRTEHNVDGVFGTPAGPGTTEFFAHCVAEPGDENRYNDRVTGARQDRSDPRLGPQERVGVVPLATGAFWMNAQLLAWSLELRDHPVEGVGIESTLGFVSHDGRKHKESAHDSVDQSAHPPIEKEGRPHRKQDVLGQPCAVVEDGTDHKEIEERTVVGGKYDAVGRAERFEVLQAPDSNPWPGEYPRKVDHEHSVPDDADGSEETENYIGHTEPEALDGPESGQLFGGGSDHLRSGLGWRNPL